MEEKIRIRPFQEEEFPLLNSWVTDAEMLFRFSGPSFSYPLRLEELQKYQVKHPDRNFYMGHLGETPFAFGEVIPQDQFSVRLGRLLIGNQELRGKGLGKRFVRGLVDIARKRPGTTLVDLYVIHDNLPAIHCYEKVGFKFSSDEHFRMVHMGTTYLLRKMHKAL